MSRLLLCFALSVGACTTEEEPPESDAGSQDGSQGCSADSDCDDGVFCNGTEECDPESDGADEDGCVVGEPPCEGECVEAEQDCAQSCPDADGDGVADEACGGSDCDDDDPDIYPGNTEVCDADGVDEDCDPRTFGFRDQDMDGSPDLECCNGEVCGTDCNDNRPDQSATAVETCDGIDNDCDSMVDEGVLVDIYPDVDGDGFGDSTVTPERGCSPEPGFVLDGTDCDDADAERHPGAFDRCDPEERDDDCDGEANNPVGGCDCKAAESRACGTGMGRCEGATQVCVDGTWGECSITPVPETCDGLDNDCNGEVDDGLMAPEYFRDQDGDGFGDENVRMRFCSPPGAGWVADMGDCYDSNPQARPTQQMYFENDRGDGSFDYDCDEDETLEIPNLVQCRGRTMCSIASPGWERRLPECGLPGRYATMCGNTGTFPDLDCEPVMVGMMTARCR